jgi:hypothetical protein
MLQHTEDIYLLAHNVTREGQQMLKAYNLLKTCHIIAFNKVGYIHLLHANLGLC